MLLFNKLTSMVVLRMVIVMSSQHTHILQTWTQAHEQPYMSAC